MNIKITSKDGLTLKTKGKYCKEDISVSVDESLMGDNIEVPSVTNLTCDSNGKANWEKPDVSNLEQSGYVISYVVTINNTRVVETNNTTIDTSMYLEETINTVAVKVKATKYGENGEVSFEYSRVASITILETKLTSNNAYSRAFTKDNYIYILGGYNQRSDKYHNTILKFDTETETITTLDVTLKHSSAYISGIIVGDNIYLKAGSEFIKFDTKTETIIQLEVSGTFNSYMGCWCAKGKYIYSFGGSTGTSTITKFDTETETITTLETTLPNNLCDACSNIKDNYIYIFGGNSNHNTYLNTILKFDTETETITTLSVKTPKRCSGGNAVTLGDYIYIIGGSYPRHTNIMKFNTNTETIITLSNKMPEYEENYYSFAMALHRYNVFVFGGDPVACDNYNIVKISNLDKLK